MVADVRRGASTPRYSPHEWAVAGSFLFLAILTRFYRIATPPAVVFDEFHFGKFTNYLVNRTHFFDIHPPLGKLTLAGLGHLFGYERIEGFMYDNIGKSYLDSGTNFTVLRFISAFFGTFSIPLAYFTSLELDLQPDSALIPPTALLLDFLNLMESRLILMDSQLLFYCVLSLYCALRLFRHQKMRAPARPRSPDPSRRMVIPSSTHQATKVPTMTRLPSSSPIGPVAEESWANEKARIRARAPWLVATALSCGLALSIKWTALATPGLIALVSLLGVYPATSPLTIPECAVAAVLGLGLYVFFFKVAFIVMKKSGPGDVWMPKEFQATLIGSKYFDPAQKKPSFWKMFFHLNYKMGSSNAGIKKRHPWESHWFEWMVNWRGVMYYSDRDRKDGTTVLVYLLGNPVVCYFCLLCAGSFLLAVLFLARYRHWLLSGVANRARLRNLQAGIFLLIGYALNLLPYILVDRAAFIYHYIPGLYFSMLLSGVAIDFLPGRVRRVAIVLAMAAMACGFVYWAPWVYAVPLNNKQHAARRWLPRWN